MGIQNDPEKEELKKEETAAESGGIKIEDGNAPCAAEAETEAPEADETAAEAEETAEEVSEEEAQTDDEAADEPEQPKERKLNWAKKAAAKKESAEEKLNTLLDEANDKYARLFAEFDNFRKRTEKEKIARYDMGARDVIEKILPVIDNFERGFDSVEESDKEDAFVTGMDLIYKQLQKVLEDLGVKPIEAVGKEFNPDLHNAVMHVDDPEAGDNIVVEEFQKGYMYKDQVVRYSMVKVAN